MSGIELTVNIIISTFTGVLTGLIVYKLTYNHEQKKRVNQEKHRLKQELIRFISKLQHELDNYKSSDDAFSIRMKFMEIPYSTIYSELDESFAGQLQPVYDKLQEVFSCFEEENLVDKEDGRFPMFLTIYRIDLIHLINVLQVETKTVSLGKKVINAIKRFLNPNFYDSTR